MKNGAQPLPNDRSNFALGRWSGTSDASAIGSNSRILNPAKHQRSDFSSLEILQHHFSQNLSQQPALLLRSSRVASAARAATF